MVGAIPVLQWGKQLNLPSPSRLCPATGWTKVELLVIVVETPTVNPCPGLVLTARQAPGGGWPAPPFPPLPASVEGGEGGSQSRPATGVKS